MSFVSVFGRSVALMAKASSGGSHQAMNLKAARRHLKNYGVNALLPSLHAKYKDTTTTNLHALPPSERSWHNPNISRRKARVLRKHAIREGTYGAFDPETGNGWDPAWDIAYATNTVQGYGRYNVIRIPKKTSRQRTREQRAQNIENKMDGMDERMEELHAEKHRNKPKKTFEYIYKKMMRGGK